MKMSIGMKLGAGFGVVILLVAILFAASWYMGGQVGHAVHHAEATGNHARFMVEKLVDHYKWLDGLNKTVVFNKEHVDVATDASECALGKWLASDEAKQLAAEDPEVARIFKAMEEPHRRLHHTAHKVDQLWTQKHEGFAEKLYVIKEAHQLWAAEVANALIRKDTELHVQTDPNKCALGKFLESSEAQKWVREFDAFAQALRKLDQPHRQLHESAIDIEKAMKAGDWDQANAIYRDVSLVCLEQVGTQLDAAVQAEQEILHNQEKAREIIQTETAAALDETQALLVELRDHLSNSVKQRNAEANGQLATMSWTNLVIFLLASAISVVVAVVITRGIIAGIRCVLGGFAKIADGDLTASCPAQAKDEIGDLARGFNKLVGDLRAIIMEVSSSADEVASASTEIASSSEEMASSMEEQTAQVVEVASAVEEINSSLSEVATQTAHANETASESGKVAEDGGDAVRATAEGMESIRDTVNKAASMVEQLGERSEAIGAIVETINDIADQTNLLALNAAIEAARAGEHGRGFAVVADEVRKLADRTTKATAEISESITTIQDETRQAVEGMQSGEEHVNRGTELAAQATQHLQRIVGGAKEIRELISSISAATEQQTTASGQISQGMSQMESATTQANEGARQAAMAATNLSHKAESLRTLVSRFRYDVKEAKTATHKPCSKDQG